MLQQPLSWYRRHKILFWCITGLILSYTLAGFIAAPLIVQRILTHQASAALHRQVQADRVRANPYTFSLRIGELSISDPDGSPFVHIGDLSVNVDPLISLFKWGAVVQSLHVNAFQARVIRTGKGQLNFSDLLPSSQGSDSKRTRPESKSLRLVVGMFKLTGGEIRFVDKSLTNPFETTLSDLEVTLSELDTLPEAGAFNCHLSARTEADERVQIDGRADIAPLLAETDVAFKRLALAKYASYYRPYLNARITEGAMDLQAKLQWSDQTRTVGDLLVAVYGVAMKDSSGAMTLASLPRLTLEGAAIDLNARRIRLGRIRSNDARVHIQRSAQGEVNLLSAFAHQAMAASEPDAPQAPGPTVPEPAWEIIAPESALENYRVDFDDLQPTPPVRISLHPIAVSALNLSTQRQAQGQVDIQLGLADQGDLSAQGDMGLVPLRATLQVAAKSVDIRPLQPYLKQYVQLVITKGEFNTRGQLEVIPDESAPGKTSAVKFAGQASLNGVEAVDAQKSALFSRWKSLFLTGIDVSTAPLSVKIDEVALTDFYKRLIINTDGTANIDTIFGRRRKVAAAQRQSGSAPPADPPSGANVGPSGATGIDIKIKTVTLQGGKVDFSDQHIKPNVRLVMEDLGGRISGLDNIKENKADVLLRGTVGGNTPLEIKGQVNPLIEKPFVDLDLNFPGIDLSPFGPYSGKYLGYSLDKGQLAFTLSYQLVDNKLSGQNKIQFNQLAFGDSVSSPQATKLPVKLAVALLKDREGNIDLDLAVKGDLDDPEFSLGGIIMKMFVNLIKNIISAPFKMLGALFGGGEELAYLAFDPGQSVLAPERLQKLDTLAKILFERPGLKLEIKGMVDPQQDTDGLRQLQFEHNLKATKLRTLVAAGRKAVPLDEIEISAPERDAMIQEAFDAATFPKPRDEKGQLKKLSPFEMEKLLNTAIAISTDELRQLAYERASTAKEYLLAAGHIEAGRLFVTEPIIPGRETQGESKPQVQFNLK